MTAAPVAEEVPVRLTWATRLGVAWACFFWPPWLELISLSRLVATPRRALAWPDAGWLAAVMAEVDRRLAGAPWPWTRTCLRRALVLQRVLARRGHAVSLVVGVRKEGGELQAHAWLERDGRPVLEVEPERVPTYAVMGRFPEHR